MSDRDRRLQPAPIPAVTVDDDFWTPVQERVRDVTLDHVYEHLQTEGRLDNFRKAAGRIEGDFEGRLYVDSDVYKWLEAASHSLAAAHDQALTERVEAVVSLVRAAQRPDGYLNTYFQLEESPEHRWTNLSTMHELFCAGHLFEAAVAHHRATGEDALLDVATDLADHVCAEFGSDANTGYPGHPEIELALVRLYRETGTERYLDQAAFFLEERGREDSRFAWERDHEDEIAGGVPDAYLGPDGEYDGSYAQDHRPVSEQAAAVGHAVKATFLYCGMADVAAETGDERLVEALDRIWTSMRTRRMYVTGGIGSTHEGERFTEDDDLPHDTAYAETCAAQGSVAWNHRMLQQYREGRFGDLIERTLYNGFLAGMDLAGRRFFYANPLEVLDGDHELSDVSSALFGGTRREWFGTPCCPTNVPRLMTSLANYAYLRDDETGTVYVDQYLTSSYETRLDGRPVTLRQASALPWSGDVSLTVETDESVDATIAVRIPAWAEGPTVAVNGTPVSATGDEADGYRRLSRTWEDGDVVDLTLPVCPRFVEAHPAVRDTVGRVALQRGPLVYCLEAMDNPEPLRAVAVAGDRLEATHRPDLLGGVTVLDGDAVVPAAGEWTDSLYRPSGSVDTVETSFTAVPYYAWGNREAGDMKIWIRDER